MFLENEKAEGNPCECPLRPISFIGSREPDVYSTVQKILSEVLRVG